MHQKGLRYRAAETVGVTALTLGIVARRLAEMALLWLILCLLVIAFFVALVLLDGLLWHAR